MNRSEEATKFDGPVVTQRRFVWKILSLILESAHDAMREVMKLWKRIVIVSAATTARRLSLNLITPFLFGPSKHLRTPVPFQGLGKRKLLVRLYENRSQGNIL
jgi:hypothetical protein